MRRLRAALLLLGVLTWSAVVSAAIVNLTGFEAGPPASSTDAEYSNSSGTFSIQTSVKRTGAYALRTNPTTTNTGWVALSAYGAGGTAGSLNAATAYSAFYLRGDTFAAANDEPIFQARSGSAQKFELRVNASRQLVAYDQASVLIATGSTVLSTGTFYCIAVEIGTGVTGNWSVAVNGVGEFSGTSDLTAVNNDNFRYGKVVNRNGQSVDYYFDDIIIDTGSQPSCGKQVDVMLPDSDGVATTWTIGAGAGADWENVDELPHDSNTTHLLSTLVSGDASTVGLETGAAAGVSGTVAAVKSMTVLIRDGAANGTVAQRFRSASTNSDGTNQNVGNNLESFSRVFVTDPATSAAWVLAALDSVEVGVIEAETVDRSRWTAGWLHVLFDPAGGGGGTPACRGKLTTVGAGC